MERTIPEKELSRFVITLPNTEAGLEEKYLGIKFVKIPLKIPAYGKNRIVFWIYHRNLLPKIAGLYDSGDGKRLTGVFICDYFGFFYRKIPVNSALSRVTPLHESFHGFLHLNNSPLNLIHPVPELPNLGQAIKFMESEVILKVVNEGFCEWAAYETLLRIRGISDRMDLCRLHRLFICKREPVDGADKIDYDSFIFEGMQNIGILADYRTGRDLLMKDSQKFSEKLAASSYDTGHHFVNEVIKDLGGMDAALPEAIHLLIKNPPKTIEHLKNPHDFSRLLIAKG
ncbi:hypothetical protein HYW46_03175 [Candidatus Daviesbacteria bacterium]|nr:hypothetical protein [Candidatus Daviesbacteria bacterium]